MSCKGQCHKYAVHTSYPARPYEHGLVKCTPCGVFLPAKYDKCPCCHVRLRRKPHVKEHQRKKRERLERNTPCEVIYP